MKTHQFAMSLLFLPIVVAGCGGNHNAPQSAGGNDPEITSAAPGPNDATLPEETANSVGNADRPPAEPPIESGSRAPEVNLERTAGPVYAVAEYDATRDPQADLDAAVQQASRDGKRILLEIGGNW